MWYWAKLLRRIYLGRIDYIILHHFVMIPLISHHSSDSQGEVIPIIPVSYSKLVVYPIISFKHTHIMDIMGYTPN